MSALKPSLKKIGKVAIDDRGNGTYYLWVAHKSTRGVDITFHADHVVIRNTTLSSKTDYQLANLLIQATVELTMGVVLDEDDQVITLPAYDDNAIEKRINSDCNTVLALISAGQDLTIFCPIREVYFGKRMHKRFASIMGGVVSRSMLDLILEINYGYSNCFATSKKQTSKEGEEPKILATLTNNGDYIIDKPDYLSILVDDDRIIVFTNEDLIKVLPVDWKLLDEYNIYAPKLSTQSWESLVERVKEFDQFELL